MRAIFDPKLAITLAIVVREGSISAAARALEVAQPWVSEQVRKLENQLGERLLIRTSRHMELTEAGRLFLPLAQAVSEANDAAQHHAAEMRSSADRHVRIGAIDYTIGMEERVLLIDNFMERNPRAQLQIVGGKPASLLQQLTAGDLDIAFLHVQDVSDRDDLACIGLGRAYASVLVPMGDPLAAYPEIPLSALAGRQIAVSPGRTDVHARNVALAPLEAIGVELVGAPDENRLAIATFAARRKLICFWWDRERLPRHVRGQQVYIPIIGKPMHNEFSVFRRQSDTRGKIMRFWSAAEHFAAQRTKPPSSVD